jgi:uncharacterized damage-inducible protein DinB
MNDERAVLQAYLSEVRRQVLGSLAGLSDEQLRRTMLPSSWSFVGLVNHLAIDVERFWFRAVMAGEKSAWESFEVDDASAWDVDRDVAPATVLELYAEVARRADEYIATTQLDEPPATWPTELFGSFRLEKLREIILHVITETSRHVGHLDAARELLDGKQWLVLDGGRTKPNDNTVGPKTPD